MKIYMSTVIKVSITIIFPYENSNNLRLVFSHCASAQCHRIIKSIIHDNGNVYSCLVDASISFDRVHCRRLFKILIERKVFFKFIRLLLESYLRQLSCVACEFF